uniref:Uncharacterized protein n=1 Tax=Oryza sativa subsp. japonica TaxID=39947 RepID=Q8LME0_ORYSJ|nr:Hypothetical protein [Oryza sativa Japonica Group]
MRPPPTSPRHCGLRRRASAWCEARTAEDVAAATSPAWGATVEDAAASDVVVGLPPGAPALPSAIHGAAVNAHLRLHPRGRPGSKETRWDAKNLLTWLWLAVECGRIIFYVVSHDPPKVSPMKPGETGHDTKEDHHTSQVSCDSTTYQISDDSYHVSGDTREVSCDSYQVSCNFYDVSGVILVRYHIHMIPTRYQKLGIKVLRHRRRRPRPPPSTLHTEPEPRHRQLHPLPSTVHIGARRQRPRPLSGARHRRPCPSSTPQPVSASSTPELVAGAAATTTQDPPPSTPHAGARRWRRLCHHAGLSAVHVTMLHAGACRRPRPSRWSSSPAAASSTPELGGGGCVRATGVSLVCAAPMVAYALVSEGGGLGAIPLGQYPNGIPVDHGSSEPGGSRPAASAPCRHGNG